jgi:hypothetical protein
MWAGVPPIQLRQDREPPSRCVAVSLNLEGYTSRARAASCLAQPGGSDAVWAGVPPIQLHQDNLQSASR